MLYPPPRLLPTLGLLLLLFITADLLVGSTVTRVLPDRLQNKLPSFLHNPPQLKHDSHPIRSLMRQADTSFKAYISSRPHTFAETVSRYRRLHRRHPPPGFDKWYLFARSKGVAMIDDYTQITDDLRPFWGVEPKELRRRVKGLLKENEGMGGVRVRAGKTERLDDKWRTVEFERMINASAQWLPDLEVVMNSQDQPRVLVEWGDLQSALALEEQTRGLGEVKNSFSEGMWDDEEGELPGGNWIKLAGKPYMDTATSSCPPDSWARTSSNSFPELMNAELVKATYLIPERLVHNFNISSDLCTVGPELGQQHGLLFSATTLTTSRDLIPVFGECKTNVNNDILFPANMYYKTDARYDYDPTGDIPWNKKKDMAIWRGVTSGGYMTEGNWRRLHRHRLVLLTNSTLLENDNRNLPLLSQSEERGENYTLHEFSPTDFAATHTDVGFTELKCEASGCPWLESVLSPVPETPMAEQFGNKYLLDIDGHSFSGRFRAFLLSHSLPIKATIFREWQDERLFPWRHFVPMGNMFEELYSLLGYFIGVGEKGGREGDNGRGVRVQEHGEEGRRIAEEGRRWAQRVLRREDMEVYVMRLMLEYARVVDDRRDGIGYNGNGTEIEESPEWIEGEWKMEDELE